MTDDSNSWSARHQWLWVVVALFFPAILIALIGWISDTMETTAVQTIQPSLTTEIWKPGASSFVLGPSLNFGHETSEAVLLENGAVLVVGESGAEILPSGGKTFRAARQPAIGRGATAALLAVPDGALWIDYRGQALRYRSTLDSWEETQLLGQQDEVRCAQVHASSTLMVYWKSVENDRPITRLSVFDLLGNKAPVVTRPSLLISRCATAGDLLIEMDDGRTEAHDLGMQAVHLRPVGYGRFLHEVLPLSPLKLRVPDRIVSQDPSHHTLVTFSPFRVQTLNLATGETQTLRLPDLSDRDGTTSVLLDDSRACVVGGKAPVVGSALDADEGARLKGNVYVVDLASGKVREGPSLLRRRAKPFVVRMADGGLLVGGGQEPAHVVLVAVIAKRVLAWSLLAACVLVLVLLLAKAPPRRRTIALSIAALLIGLVVLGFMALSGIRPGD